MLSWRAVTVKKYQVLTNSNKTWQSERVFFQAFGEQSWELKRGRWWTVRRARGFPQSANLWNWLIKTKSTVKHRKWALINWNSGLYGMKREDYLGITSPSPWGGWNHFTNTGSATAAGLLSNWLEWCGWRRGALVGYFWAVSGAPTLTVINN